MLVDELKPNMVTFVSLLPSFENLGRIPYVESFHACVFKSGVNKGPSIVVALVLVYAKLGGMVSAEFLFHDTKVGNLLLWNSMVSAHASHGFCERSLEAFRLVQLDGFDPDAISILSLLMSCSQLKSSVLGKFDVFVIRKIIESNVNVLNALLAFYFDSSEMVYSFRIFDRMVSKSVVLWNTMISGCVDKGKLERAMLLFHHMRQEGFEFDLVTLISIIPSCHVWRRSLLGLAINARLFFDDMPKKSVVYWNTILAGYCQYNLQKETIKLFNDMIQKNQRPSYVTLLNVSLACEVLHQETSISVWNTLISTNLLEVVDFGLAKLLLFNATWEDVAEMRSQFPNFELEGKFALE